MAITSTINIPSSGAAGRILNTILNGSTNPPASQGITGDFWLNTASLTLFGPKARTGWPAEGQSLRGSGSGSGGGNRFFWGDGPPSPELGQQADDAYIDRTNSILYQAS